MFKGSFKSTFGCLSLIVIALVVVVWPGREVGYHHEITSVALSPDGKLLATGGASQPFRLWDIATGKQLRELETNSGRMMVSVAFSPDGKTVATRAYSRPIRLWDVESGRKVRQFGAGASLAFSADGKMIASACAPNQICIWDVNTGTERKFETAEMRASSLAFSPDGKTLVSAGGGQYNNEMKLYPAEVILLDTHTGKTKSLPTSHTESVHSVAFSADGKTFASGSHDSTIALWDVAEGVEIRRFRPHSAVFCVAFSPDGKLLASGDYKGDIKLWEVVTGKEFLTWKGHDWIVFSIVFSLDGKILASGSHDETARIWETDTGKELRTISHHSSNWF